MEINVHMRLETNKTVAFFQPAFEFDISVVKLLKNCEKQTSIVLSNINSTNIFMRAIMLDDKNIEDGFYTIMCNQIMSFRKQCISDWTKIHQYCFI